MATAVAFLTGTPVQGRIGVGGRPRGVRAGAAAAPSLTVGDIDRAISELAGMSGAGVTAARRALLTDVFSRATAPEQGLLWRIFSGELRHGALDGVMVEAIAKAASVPVAAVRRAHMMSGDLGRSSRGRIVRRRAGAPIDRHVSRAVPCSRCWQHRPLTSRTRSPRPGRPRSSGSSTARGCRPIGAMVTCGLYTRNLNDITDRLGGVAALVAGLPGGDLVLDGEVLGVDDEGTPRRFQDTMGDFGADAPTRRGAGLSAYFFDVLHAGGEPTVDEPLSVRREVLATIVPATSRLPSLVTADVDEADVVPRSRRRRRPRGSDGQGVARAVRRRPARWGVAEGEARAHARSRRVGR